MRLIKNTFTAFLFISFLSVVQEAFSHADHSHLLSAVRESTIVEVLAESHTRDGQGEIKVLRHPNDGISIVKTFPIGYYYEAPRSVEELSLADQLSYVYLDLTGKELPLVAYKALQNLEREKTGNVARNSRNQQQEFLNKPNKPSGYYKYCFNDFSGAPKKPFRYDCDWVHDSFGANHYADDLCLMITAKKGDTKLVIGRDIISWDVPYDASAYPVKIDYMVNVKAGYYAAVQRLTAIVKMRHGAGITDFHNIFGYYFVGESDLFSKKFVTTSDCGKKANQ